MNENERSFKQLVEDCVNWLLRKRIEYNGNNQYIKKK